MSSNSLIRYLSMILVFVLLICSFPRVDADEIIEPIPQLNEPGMKALLTDEQLDAETAILVDWLLTKQYAYDLIYFNSMEDVYNVLSMHYNILSELETRIDADKLLFSRYVQLMETEIDLTTDEGVYEQLNLTLLSVMMRQRCFQDGLNDEEIGVLERLNGSIASSRATSYPSSFQGPTGIWYRLAGYTYTPNGTAVGLYQAQADLTSAQKAEFNSKNAAEHPNASRLVDPSSRYNCHAYAWYSNTAQYWIKEASPYLSDPNYEDLTDSSEAITGDIVVYYNSLNQVTHSAVVVSNSENGIYCISKWGSAGKYRHRIDDVPWTYYAGYSTPYYRVFYLDN